MSWGDPPPTELEPQDSPQHPLAPWFATWRGDRQRGGAAGGRGTPPRRALITIVHNEPVFFPLWLRYYSRWFAPEDIYVLDHETTDGSTAGGGFVRIPVEHPTVDHPWMVETITDLQHDLLSRYELTVVTDVDEIVAPAPALGDLGAYLDHFDEDWVNCLGYEILHLRDSEPPLVFDRLILDQRRWWFWNDGYDKAAVATVPMRWRPGFHGREDFQFAPDPDLRLIHLHRVDYDTCRARHLLRSQRPWAELDAREGWAAHNMISEERAFDRWFYEDSNLAGVPIRPEAIPAQWQGVF
ncbi:MAG: glycosyltransferase family 2 protein [Actinomycetota bacterium]|nr:glycosyltransferase family 2 protein [Actinomycetota bacterium]